MMAGCGHPHVPPTSHGLLPPPGRITLLVLAAGCSSRMGTCKAILPLSAPWGEPPGERAIARILRLAEAVGIERRLVVLGHGAEAIRPHVARRATLATNPEPERGMFSSVLVGLRVAVEVQRPPDAVLLWPTDVPLLAASTLHTLLEAGARPLAKATTPWVRLPCLKDDLETTGHPILLSRATCQMVLTADPERDRLDHVLATRGIITQRVPVEDRLMLIDLDTPTDAAPYVVGDYADPW